MPVILKNNASSTLTTAVTTSDTGIVVANGSRFPTVTAGDYFYATLVSPAGTTEIVKVTARAGNSMTVVRAQDGATAASFQVGTLVEMRVNAASVAELRDEATEITIADAGGYYTSDTIEGALQEVGGVKNPKSVATLLADTALTYTSGQIGTVVAGDVVRTRVEGFSYAVAASAATNQHVTTAGGVKLYAQPDTGGYNVEAFGAVGDGVTNCSVKIQAALAAASSVGGGRVKISRGTFKLEAPISLPSYVVITGDGKNNTKLVRAFTGDCVSSMGGYSGIQYLTIDGQTSTYGLGRGIVFSGSTPNSFMLQAEVTNFSQSCLEFGVNAGATFRAVQCDFYTTGAVGIVAAVKVSGTDTVATSRHFTDCESGGCTLYDFGGANDLYVSGGFTSGLIFGATGSKVMIVNLRVGSSAGTVTITGAAHQITNCVFAAPVIITGQDITFNCQVPDYNITVNGTGCSVFIKSRAYTPTWTASGGGASIGDGSISGRFSRSGNVVNFQIDMTLGSTSTVGSGSWEFTLPVPDTGFSPVQLCGIGFAVNGAASASVVFAVRVSPGAQRVNGFYSVGGSGAPANLGATTPTATWGSNSVIRLSGSYYVP